MNKILIVDDSRYMLALLEMFFEDLDYTVVKASNGEEALAAFLKDPADIIVTDIQMPGMDGLELIKYVRQNFNHTKILAYSGADNSTSNNGYCGFDYWGIWWLDVFITAIKVSVA